MPSAAAAASGQGAPSAAAQANAAQGQGQAAAGAAASAAAAAAQGGIGPSTEPFFRNFPELAGYTKGLGCTMSPATMLQCSAVDVLS